MEKLQTFKEELKGVIDVQKSLKNNEIDFFE